MVQADNFVVGIYSKTVPNMWNGTSGGGYTYICIPKTYFGK